MWNESELLARSRRAYELGRLRGGLAQAALVAPLLALSFLSCVPSWRPVAAAALALLAFVAAAAWRGQDWGRGARAGLLCGLAPFLLPLGAQALGHACSASLCLYLPTACLLGGLLGGLALASLGLRPRRDGRAYVVAACGATVLCGAVGCLLAGLGGLLGLGLGLCAGAAPVLLLRRA